MKKRTKIVLAITIVTAVIGTLSKLNGYKMFGNVFLGISTILWLFLVYTLIIWFINKK